MPHVGRCSEAEALAEITGILGRVKAKSGSAASVELSTAATRSLEPNRSGDEH
jgi:hypothetical protein